MDRKNFISKLFLIGIASVIPKAFMKPTIYKGAFFRLDNKGNYVRIGDPRMNPSRRYIVGERGPEIYIPHTSGRIIPTRNLSG